MRNQLTRRQVLGAMSLWATAPFLPAVSRVLADDRALSDQRDKMKTGYSLRYSYPFDELIGDLLHGERGESERESDIPHHEWYSRETRRQFEAWGPDQRLYAALPGLADRPLQWKRERVIATAARFIGYEYQHHHVPDWNPPANWPWKECCAGHNGRGVDCSNFTSFVYNQGFGIKMNAAIERQSELKSALEGREYRVPIRRIDLPDDYAQRREVLRTGDLVYIRGREDGPVTHVIIWVGSVCSSPSDTPMIMDSHGGNVDDDWGRQIPCGIHLRPFRKDLWYDRCASHAHRIFYNV